MRGDSENRNKELKCDLCAGRLSDHRFMATMFRVLLHCMAHNLVVKLRQLVALPTPLPVVESGMTPSDAVVTLSNSSTDASDKPSVDAAASNAGIHTRLHSVAFFLFTANCHQFKSVPVSRSSTKSARQPSSITLRRISSPLTVPRG